MTFCTNCGEGESDASSFCGNCGTRFSDGLAPASSASSAVPQRPRPSYSTNQSGSRNGGDVLVGVLAGLLLGIFGVLANLLLNRNDEQKNERRKDRLFGSWFGLGAGAFILVALLALTIADGESDAMAVAPTAVPNQPDVVVGVRTICKENCNPPPECTGLRRVPGCGVSNRSTG